MKLYNTLSKKLDDLQPSDGKTIRIYTCGPTVYDHSHVGNLSSFIFADTLRRTVAASGFEVKHVMNFTDVDDKTIRKASELQGSDPKTALKLITEKYEEIFLQDMKSIGNDVETINFIKATEHIGEMQALITTLYDAGFAYIADDGIYFSIEKYKKAGKKYGQLLEITSSSTANARIQNDEYDKDSAHDFALWKIEKPGEPAWQFTLNGKSVNGRPGWHIECSAMSQAELGLPFDIHTGGIDLIFPHHENEIAQSTAAMDNPLMASIFTHNGHLLIDGKKMSKSLNNFYTLEDIKAKGFEPLAFRLLVLQAHYRSQANFTWEALEGAQNRLQELRAWADLRHQPSSDKMPVELDVLFKNTRESIQAALENDLNSPIALAALGKLVNYMMSNPVPGIEGKHTDGMLKFLDDVLGLGLSKRPDITSEQKELIENRETARKEKDWQKADQVRQTLLDQGIALKDTAFGIQWSRV